MYQGLAPTWYILLCLCPSLPKHLIATIARYVLVKKVKVAKGCLGFEGREVRKVDRVGSRPLFQLIVCPRSLTKEENMLRLLIFLKKRVSDSVQRVCMLNA